MAEYVAKRQPLRLPAGSIRAMLSTLIVGMFWLLLLMPANKQITVPMYLYFLAGMVMLFVFAHGKTISRPDEPAPLYLPRGTFRFLILVGTIAVLGLHYYLRNQSPLETLKPNAQQLDQWPRLAIAMLGGLIVGWLAGRGPWRDAAWFQDFQAWISLLAMLGLVIDLVIVTFINPHVAENLRLDMGVLEAILVGLVAWYFGARS